MRGNPWKALLRELARLLEQQGAEWAVFGSVAANLYRPATRTTHDVDLLVSLPPEGLRRLANDATNSGWSVPFLDPDGSLLRIAHPDLGAADLVAVESECQREALRRARATPAGEGLPVRVLTIEDVVIHMLIPGRLQGYADIEAILEAEPELDETYLNDRALQWEVADKLAAIRNRLDELG